MSLPFQALRVFVLCWSENKTMKRVESRPLVAQGAEPENRPLGVDQTGPGVGKEAWKDNLGSWFLGRWPGFRILHLWFVVKSLAHEVNPRLLGPPFKTPHICHALSFLSQLPEHPASEWNTNDALSVGRWEAQRAGTGILSCMCRGKKRLLGPC